MPTLFGHLAARMTNQVENLATEGLLFVLKNSAEARRLLTDFLRQSGAVLAEGLTFRSQAADADGAIPDIAGDAPDGTTPVLVEAKFWAGLTAHQPNTYLGRLPTGRLLAFVAPAARLTPLWPELLKRCRERTEYREEQRSAEWRVAATPDGTRLALTSWRAVLNWLHAGLVGADEPDAAADVAQLRGLADRMDEDAFLPFTSEQLTGDAPRVVCQLCQLIDAAVSRLVEVGAGERARAVGSGWGQYWHYFWAKGYLWALLFTPYDWKQSGSPVWLMVATDTNSPSPAANKALDPLTRRVPSDFFVEADGWGYVRIGVPAGVELDEAAGRVADQVREAIALVPDVS